MTATVASLPSTLLNIALFQLGWFCCVLGAAHGMAWLGPVVSSAIALFYLWRDSDWSREARMLIGIVLMGTALDSVLISAGLIQFQGAIWPSPWAPLWISALWLVFGVTLTRSMSWIQSHPIWAVLLGAVGGPLAYGGGAALGAAEFLGPKGAAIAALSLVWGGAMLGLTFFSAWARPRAGGRAAA